MAVIVKNIDVPAYCYACRFRRNDEGIDYCCVTDKVLEINLTTGKDATCPIKPIDKYSSREELGRHLAQNMMSIKEER